MPDVWLGFIQNLPGPTGMRLRYAFWKRRLKFLGTNVRIDPGVYFQNPEMISIGDGSWIDRGVIMLAGIDRSDRRKRVLECRRSAPSGEIVIGRNVHVGPHCILSGIEAGISIGDDCTLSASVKMYAFTHHFRFDDAPDDFSCAFGSLVEVKRQSMIAGTIVLEGNVGVALNTIILPGVLIRGDSFVKVNSVLSAQEFAENSLICGSPAKRVADRFRPNTVRSGRSD